MLVELTATATQTMDRMRREHADLNATLIAAIAPADREPVERGITALVEHLGRLVAEAESET